MTDFTAVNSEVQKLIDAAVTSQKAVDATALQAALDADAAADKAATDALNAQITKLQADLAACQAGQNPPPLDGTPPSAPTNLVATVISPTQINTTWAASTDNVGVKDYLIFRDGVQVGTSTVTSYFYIGLTAVTTYRLAVKARDAAGNLSASTWINATTGGIVVPPSSTFNPRTMTVAQIEASTGPRVTTFINKGGTVISSAGTYSGINYTGRVTIEVTGGKVLFQDCKFNGGGDWYSVINIPENYKADEIRFDYCEVRNAVNCIAGANLYVYRCDILEYENGVNFWGPGQLVESYIHAQKQSGDSPHFDGIECNGGGNIKILRSYVINTASQTSALMFNNEFGALHDIQIDGNYLSGGGYTVYFDTSKKALPTTNISVTNNTLKKGYWGWTALYNSGVVVGPTNSLI